MRVSTFLFYFFVISTRKSPFFFFRGSCVNKQLPIRFFWGREIGRVLDFRRIIIFFRMCLRGYKNFLVIKPFRCRYRIEFLSKNSEIKIKSTRDSPISRHNYFSTNFLSMCWQHLIHLHIDPYLQFSINFYDPLLSSVSPLSCFNSTIKRVF